LATFLIVLGVLWKYAWTPILEALDARSERIRSDLDGAENARAAAEQVKAEYDEHLGGARDEVREIIEEGKRDATKVKEDIVAHANQEAQEIRERASRETGLAQAKAFEELWETAADLGTELAGKIIAQSLSASDHRKLAEEVIDQYKAAVGKGV
jgi:F-type H+-transporting ATPase subunit b